MSTQNTPTPWNLIRAIEGLYEISFKYDIAASYQNNKAPYFYTEDDNSLEMDWPTDGWCFLNPPFANLGKWIEKCSEQTKRGCQIVTIWPLSGDINQIPTWRESHVNVIHGRVWPVVRGVMICVWSEKRGVPYPRSLRWDKKKGELNELVI